MIRRFLLLTVAPALAVACASSPASAPPVHEPAPPSAAPLPLPAPTEAITSPTVLRPEPSGPRVIGYFTNWAHTRRAPCEFSTRDTPTELLTHVNYAFAQVLASEDRTRFELGPTSPDDEGRLYAEVNGLKQQNPKLRTLLSVGGWVFNDPPTAWIFSAMARTPESRGHFVRQATSYLRAHGFDGLDIDWEFPGASERGGRPEDKQNFTALLNELRAHFHAEAQMTGKAELLLTIASPAGLHFYQHQELHRLHEPLDWINLMTYDYHGDWDGKVGDNAPLIDEGADIEESVAAYLANGVPRAKLVMGFATYARAFAGVEKDEKGAKSTGLGPDSPCGKESLGAHHVESWIKSGAYQRVWDATTRAPHAYNKKEKVWISFDDRRSYAAKLDFLERERLGGAMFWAIDQDDVRGGYPLIRQVSERVLAPPSGRP